MNAISDGGSRRDLLHITEAILSAVCNSGKFFETFLNHIFIN